MHEVFVVVDRRQVGVCTSGKAVATDGVGRACVSSVHSSQTRGYNLYPLGDLYISRYISHYSVHYIS